MVTCSSTTWIHWMEESARWPTSTSEFTGRYPNILCLLAVLIQMMASLILPMAKWMWIVGWKKYLDSPCICSILRRVNHSSESLSVFLLVQSPTYYNNVPCYTPRYKYTNSVFDIFVLVRLMKPHLLRLKKNCCIKLHKSCHRNKFMDF